MIPSKGFFLSLSTFEKVSLTLLNLEFSDVIVLLVCPNSIFLSNSIYRDKNIELDNVDD